MNKSVSLAEKGQLRRNRGVEAVLFSSCLGPEADIYLRYLVSRVLKKDLTKASTTQIPRCINEGWDEKMSYPFVLLILCFDPLKR